MIPWRFLVAAAVMLGLATVSPRVAAGVPSSASTADKHETSTPIKHFITLMQENHSFDNYFGTYPGADGFPPGTCMPVDPSVSDGECVKPYPLGGRAVADLAHTKEVSDAQYANGAMNGFIAAHVGRQPEAARQAMGYYDDSDLPFYWNVADEYVLFDRFFTSADGGSVRNHFFWVSGSPGNYDDDRLRVEGFDDIPTIFDRLQEAGISWKFYVQNYDPSINFRSTVEGEDAGQLVWVPLLNYNRFLDDPELNKHIVNLDEYFGDLENDNLPAVSFLVPSGASEHPPGSIQAGERFIRSLLNGLWRSPAWSSSVFTWTYDDWGGWYDHVPPPKVDEYGYGFRAPSLLVSPYAKEGHIDSTQLDFTSLLKFIEENWGVEPLAERDAKANNILSAFDFDSPPRAPVLLSRERNVVPKVEGRQGVVYASYGGAIVLAIGFILAIQGLDRRRRRPKATES